VTRRHVRGVSAECLGTRHCRKRWLSIVRERMLLFCIASGTDCQRAGVPGETVIDVIEKGLIVDHPSDRLALTMRGGRC
jgi:hypothetical protein